ncbi:MAG: nitrilase-related carbon-nitrogen hydrolase, partial [Dehalococcoidia bacterium]
MRTLRVALAQINTVVGDLDGNVAKILDYGNRARELGADLVAFPELAITGYPPEDLLLRSSFIDDNLTALGRVASELRGITAVVGFVDRDHDIYNAAAVIHEGVVAGRYHKQFPPNYGVFDEMRYFRPGERSQVYTIAGARIGVNICEDSWYPEGPIQAQSLAGADVIVNINGSPYRQGIRHTRERMLATRAADNAVIVCYVNMIGGQDELVFDGNSFVFDQDGQLLARAASFEEGLLVVDLNLDSLYLARLHAPLRRSERLIEHASPVDEVFVSLAREGGRTPHEPVIEPPLDEEAEVYRALVTGTRDYVHKNGFETVIVGMSGGIDSSLVASIAADALGPEHVVGISNPSRYSSEGSIA